MRKFKIGDMVQFTDEACQTWSDVNRFAPYIVVKHVDGERVHLNQEISIDITYKTKRFHQYWLKKSIGNLFKEDL